MLWLFSVNKLYCTVFTLYILSVDGDKCYSDVYQIILNLKGSYFSFVIFTNTNCISRGFVLTKMKIEYTPWYFSRSTCDVKDWGIWWNEITPPEGMSTHGIEKYPLLAFDHTMGSAIHTLPNVQDNLLLLWWKCGDLAH